MDDAVRDPQPARDSREDRRLTALLAYSSDIITVLDGQGRVVYFSPAVTRTLGHLPGARLGMDLLDLVHPDDRDAVAAAMAKCLAEGPGSVVTLDVRVARADGEWRHLESVASNHLDDPAVEGIVVNSRDVTDRVLAMEQLRHAAYHDPLTDLPNRLLFYDRLEQALARAARSGRDVAVLYLDLDGFKAVNDRFGHATGDLVLRQVASRVRSVIRPGDTAARLGGDELVVMAEGLALPAEAVSMANRLMDVISQPIGEIEAKVTASVGIGYGRDPEPGPLVERADQALYEAKAQGGGWWIEPCSVPPHE